MKQHDTGYKIKKEYQTVRKRIMLGTLNIKIIILTEILHMHMQILSVHHKFILTEYKNKVTEETYIETKYINNYRHSKGKLGNK